MLNTNGNTLVQVMIAAAITSIIALTFATMMNNQRNEVKAVTEKLLSQELGMQLATMIQNQNYCNCLFRGKTFDTTTTPATIVAADQFTNLVSGFLSGPSDVPACTTNGLDLIGPVGSVVAGSTMTIDSVGLGPLSVVSPSVYKADLQVSFGNVVRAFKGINTSVQFEVDSAAGAPDARPFDRCNNATPAAGVVTYALIGWGGPAYGGGWSGTRNITIDAKSCSLAAYGNDQSSAGNSQCNIFANGTDSWRLEITGSQGWVLCHWLCEDYKGTHAGSFDTFSTF